MSKHYSLCMNVENRLCVVVGAGPIAYRKTGRLLAAGAVVRVISPRWDPRFTDWMDTQQIQMVRRAFQPGDTDGALLTFAATNVPELNRQIADEVIARGGLVNVVDNKSLCTFIVPAEWSVDDLSIAISTGGKDPKRAKKLRVLLEADLATGQGQFVQAIRTYVGHS